MRHPISCDEWLGYLDNELDSAGAERVRTHIADCGECRATWEELLRATVLLRASVHQFATTHATDKVTVDHARHRVLTRIRALETVEAFAGGELTIGRLRRLQRVVAPACGANTAFRLIVAAVGKTGDPHGRAAWRSFLEQLTDLTSALCGRSTARLVWEIGNSLPLGNHAGPVD